MTKTPDTTDLTEIAQGIPSAIDNWSPRTAKKVRMGDKVLNGEIGEVVGFRENDVVVRGSANECQILSLSELYAGGADCDWYVA